MNRTPYIELREAKAEHDQAWNYGGADAQAKARKRLDAAERAVRALEQGKPRQIIAWRNR